MPTSSSSMDSIECQRVTIIYFKPRISPTLPSSRLGSSEKSYFRCEFLRRLTREGKARQWTEGLDSKRSSPYALIHLTLLGWNQVLPSR